MKKLLIFLTAALILTALPAPGLAAPPVTVTLDGEALSFDVPPVVENGRVLVPLRAIFEALGASVGWDGATSTVTAGIGTTNISLAIGQQTARKNGATLELDVPARIVQGRTMVPVRFVAEALEAQVDWQAAVRRVVVKDKQRYYDQALLDLKQGNLLDARRVVVSATRKRLFDPLPWNPPEMMKTTYYFPEGEASRYYVRLGDHFEFVEPMNMMFTTVWEGNLGETAGQTPADTLGKFLARNSPAGFSEERGERPDIDKPLVFFEFTSRNGVIRYGRIHPDGQEETLGRTDRNWEIAGGIVVEIPGENPSPATKAEEYDYDATDPVEVVRADYMSWLKEDYTISMNVLNAEVDDEETQRHFERYKGSELAESRGWTDEYLDQHFIVVKVRYECEFDHTKTFMRDGLLEGYVFLTRDPESGVWTIWTRTSPYDIPVAE